MSKSKPATDPILTDENAGKGGSYVLNEDGTRTLQHRTEPEQPDPRHKGGVKPAETKE